jgi:hypothetical protein
MAFIDLFFQLDKRVLLDNDEFAGALLFQLEDEGLLLDKVMDFLLLLSSS